MFNAHGDGFLRAYALKCWANYIETGDISLSAQDAQRMKKPFKALTHEQMALIVRLHKLADKEDTNVKL